MDKPSPALSEGEQFLQDNKSKDGVVTLPSGLQYKVISAGDGANHPTVDSPCECHYEGRTASNYPSGPKFDSSYDRRKPLEFQVGVGRVIKGWDEALLDMKVGEQRILKIPYARHSGALNACMWLHC